MTLILHQYRRSPFSEKVRLMLGFKRHVRLSHKLRRDHARRDA